MAVIFRLVYIFTTSSVILTLTQLDFLIPYLLTSPLFLYRGLAEIKLFRVLAPTSSSDTSNGDSSLSSSVNGLGSNYSLTDGKSIALPAAPTDGQFTSCGRLVMLFPAPVYLRVFTVSLSATTGDDESELKIEPMAADFAREFCDMCAKKELNFVQQVVFSEGGPEDERGIRKHTLDKPFGAFVIKPNNTHFASRSRKRHKGTPRDKNIKDGFGSGPGGGEGEEREEGHTA